MEFGFGPLFQLQLFGLVCPCAQKDEDRNALQAIQFLRGRRIKWNRSGGSGSSFSLGKLFNRGSSTSNGSNEAKGGVAVLKVRDNQNGYPALFVDSTTVLDQMTVVEGTETLDDTIPAAPRIQLGIKLSRVDKVSVDNDEFVLLAKPAPSNPKPKELLRFTVLDGDLPAKDEVRNSCQHHLAVLVEWERQRRIDMDDLYDDDDEEDNDQPNFLQARANKAAHFAKREVEMQQTRRDREKRKAQFSSAGLKYTALAMAGRQDS